jgi:hypothetical protein
MHFSEEMGVSGGRIPRQNSYAPSLSLIYDFSTSDRNSTITDSFETDADELILVGSAGGMMPNLDDHHDHPVYFGGTKPKGRSASVCRVWNKRVSNSTEETW